MKIGVSIETNRAHGRSLLEGVGDYALARRKWPEWRLEAIDSAAMTDPLSLKRYDGMIVRIMDDRTETALLRSGKPVIDTYGRKDAASIPYIRLDDGAIAVMAAKIFAEHRFTRWAYCGFPGLRFSEARGKAFAMAAQDYGAECSVYSGAERITEKIVGREKMGVPADVKALRHWLTGLPRPVAIFCCSDLRALHALEICADAGINVPREISILGCDDDKVLCSFANPPLSSIDTDAVALGRRAAQILDNLMESRVGITLQMESKTCGEVHSFSVDACSGAVLHQPRRVVERASTDFYQVKTAWLSDALVHIRRHLGEGLNVEELCRYLGYSHTTVNKVFREELGTTVKGELMRQRLMRACRLLRETKLTAASISAECGYPTPQYFAHVFAAQFGTTPERWR